MTEHAPSDEERRCGCGAFVRCTHTTSLRNARSLPTTLHHFACEKCGGRFAVGTWPSIVIPALTGVSLFGLVFGEAASLRVAALQGLAALMLLVALVEMWRWVRHPRKR